MNEIQVLPPSTNMALDTETSNFMNPNRWAIMTAMANTFIASKALPKSIENAPQLMMVMQAGFEAGMQPLQAINSFYFVNGKLSMYGDAVIAQVMRAGHKVEFYDCNDKTASCRITRGDNGQVMETTFTMEMVKARGLDRNPVFKTNPENMLKFKAFHMNAKFIAPEAVRNMQIKEVLETEMDLPVQPENVIPPKPPAKTRTTTAKTVEATVVNAPAEAPKKEEPKAPEPEAPKPEAPKADETRPTEEQAKEYLELLTENREKADGITKWITDDTQGLTFYQLSPKVAERYLTAIKKKLAVKKEEPKASEAPIIPPVWIPFLDGVKDEAGIKSMIEALEIQNATVEQIAAAREYVMKRLGLPSAE